ncbi:hypothetical protein BJ322DRAFT_1023783 [Thelephora terrestris]|uniref:ATPase AAA-type core domain-containing protein n=1 Tax=Thelephora terrestris TaxID=56493 RepID=A0A9P6H6H0_9AGAM|nr:hypothetical protein BJ322DRAFT_1023783 [Thelephora terrestris]
MYSDNSTRSAPGDPNLNKGLLRKLSPRVVFADEIDSLSGARVSSRETGGALAHRWVITEFMSKISYQDQRVVVIGTTNRPFDLDDTEVARRPSWGEGDERDLKILLKGETVAEDKALKEIAPSSSESLGTLSELRKSNDEFGEGKREKRRNMCGKGSFGFIEKGKGQGEIKIATSAGPTSMPSGGVDLRLLEL